MGNENWSSWFVWPGNKVAPVKPETTIQWKGRGVNENGSTSIMAGNLYWDHRGDPMDIIAYRYRIEENEMDSDLKWLAENVSEWGGAIGSYNRILLYNGNIDYCQSTGCDEDGTFKGCRTFTVSQWLQARKDLGLIMTESEEELPAEEWKPSAPEEKLYLGTTWRDSRRLDTKPGWHEHEWPQIFNDGDGHWFGAKAGWSMEGRISSQWKGRQVSLLKDDGEFLCYGHHEDWENSLEQRPEEWAGSVPAPLDGMTASKYNAYFKDVRHIDTIDVYRVVSLFECEKHGHPISHAAKKLLLSGSRTGGKDVEADVREAIDALYRWLEMREEDRKK